MNKFLACASRPVGVADGSHNGRPARSSLALGLALIAVASIAVGGARPADANPWPSPMITQPATVTADALPTVQINGVVWSQLVVGNTVYVGGSFSTARPAGVPQGGAGQVTRNNFLAYNLTTGQLLSNVVLNANAQVRSVTASPDGSRVYVGGDFTSFGGQPRNRVAAIATATNTVVTNFSPNVGYHVYDVAATANTVYVAGNFLNVGSQQRDRLAAFTTSGQLLSWAPSAPDRAVWAIEVSPDNGKVAIAGAFETLNGTSSFGRGFAVLDAVTGQILPFQATSIVRNGGVDGAITTLQSEGGLLYGGGYTFGRSAGTLEGLFAADWNDGAVHWINDCHGDTYSVFARGDVVYQAGHAHYCGNIGGFGQPQEWEFYRGIAFSKEVAGTVARERLGYTNFAGQPRPELLNFFPTMNAGAYTGLSQGPWSVAGNDRYIVYGGEFTSVNGVAQQGLVRFQQREFASTSQGPTLFNATYPVRVRSLAAGAVTVSWQANRDRDDATLQYRVYRRTGTSGNGQLRTTRTMTAPFWNRPVMTWTDAASDVTPGTTYQYRVQVVDPDGNIANTSWTSVTVAQSGSMSAYADSVLQDDPDSFWRLGESSGTTAVDLAGWRDMTYSSSGVTLGQAGATADGDRAARFSGGTNVMAAATQIELPPHTMSLEGWFRAASNANGGLIVGFNSSGSGAGSTNTQDRHIYMDTTGRVRFAVNPTNPVTLSSSGNLRDNAWHHVVGTLGSDGMALYIDGAQVATNPSVQWARTGYYGYWRIGGGALNSFPSTNTSTGRWFDGEIDDVALYKHVLAPTQVVDHYAASGRLAPPLPNVPPSSSFASSIDPGNPLRVLLDGTGSTDGDGTIVSWSWNFGDGTPSASGPTTTHTYQSAGTYTVTLTVTDDDGATNQTTGQVTPAAPNAAPVARFTSTVDGQAVTFDGTTSSDPDGTISSWSWNFGDGSAPVTLTVPTVDHTYDSAGIHDVTLTVTDNNGTSTQRVAGVSTNDLPPVPPANGAVVAADGFERSVTGGLGNADVGGPWTVSGTTANYSVDGGAALIRLASAGAGPTASLAGVSTSNASMTFDISVDKPGTGGGIYGTVVGRRIGNDEYRAVLRYQSNGALMAILQRRTGSTDATLAVANSVAGVPAAAGQSVRAKFEVIGVNPTQLRLKVWPTAQPEPANWLLTAADSTASLQGPGSVRLAPYLSGSTTNAPVIVSFDNFAVVDPTVVATTDPVARFSSMIDGLATGFDASNSADDGSIVGWNWDFGDGQQSTQGPIVNHVYASAGTYQVRLTVVDNDGNSNDIVLAVTTNAP